MLSADAMWRYLAQLGIFPDQPHPCFGKKPSDAVEALLKKRCDHAHWCFTAWLAACCVDSQLQTVLLLLSCLQAHQHWA